MQLFQLPVSTRNPVARQLRRDVEAHSQRQGALPPLHRVFTPAPTPADEGRFIARAIPTVTLTEAQLRPVNKKTPTTQESARQAPVSPAAD